MENISQFLDHIQKDNTALIVRRNGQPPEWSDAKWHQGVYARNPELYALLALVEKVQPWQQVRILLQLLQASRAGMEGDLRRLHDRVVAVLLAILPGDRVLTVFLALRRLRANHKHTTRAIVNYILNHPYLEDLVSCRSPAVVDSLEHALGLNVARSRSVAPAIRAAWRQPCLCENVSRTQDRSNSNIFASPFTALRPGWGMGKIKFSPVIRSGNWSC